MEYKDAWFKFKRVRTAADALPLAEFCIMAWAKAEELCKYCGKNDYEFGFGPRTLSICFCCQAVGAHVACEERCEGTRLCQATVEAREWFCSQVEDSYLTSLKAHWRSSNAQ